MWTRIKVWLIVKLHLPVRYVKLSSAQMEEARRLLNH
jgi:hypothetical protein